MLLPINTYVNNAMECKLLESSVYIGTSGQYRLCCTSMEPTNKEHVLTHTPKEWLNSEIVSNAKKQLANNEWPSACIRCKLEEEAGLESRRLQKSHYGPGITHLDLRLGNSCNLKCISCWPMSSSSINQEAREMQQKGFIPLHPVVEHSILNWYDERFLSYFEDMPLQEVYLTGGEPMMVKHLPDLLERLDPSVTIRFNTNGTIFNPTVYKLLKKFKTVIMSLSIDAVGKKIEYIRYGSKWNDVEQNTFRFAEVSNIDITPTISVLNALYYDELLDWCSNNNFKIKDNLLLNPEYLNIKNAPEVLKSQFKHFSAWSEGSSNINQQEEFIRSITKLDKFRNISIKHYLPEVAKAYGIN